MNICLICGKQLNIKEYLYCKECLLKWLKKDD